MPDPELSSRSPRRRRRGTHVSRVPYLPGLDGMRALAVIAVMVYHTANGWLPGGFIGVEVFFVISGYLITLLLIGEHEQSGRVSLRHFWLRRARRLLPALYFMLLLVVSYTAIFRREELGNIRGDVFAGVGYVSNWYQIWTGQGYTSAMEFAPLRHLWSLAVEEQFYLVWPLVMAVLLRRSPRRVPGLSRWLFVAAILIAVVTALVVPTGPAISPAVTPDAYWNVAGRSISKVDTLYLSTITRATGLLIGSAFAMMWRPVAVMRGPVRDKGWAVDLLAVIGLVSLGLLAWRLHLITASGPDQLLFKGGLIAVALATVLVIAAVTHSRAWTGRVLGMPLLVWVGVRSYGLYLFHWPVYQVIRRVAGNRLTVTQFVLALAVTLAITEFSYRVIEMPVRKRRLGRVWARLQQHRDPVPRRIIGVGAAACVALVGFAGASLATAQLRPSEYEQNQAAAEEYTTGLLTVATAPGGSGATVATPDPPGAPAIPVISVDEAGAGPTTEPSAPSPAAEVIVPAMLDSTGPADTSELDTTGPDTSRPDTTDPDTTDPDTTDPDTTGPAPTGPAPTAPAPTAPAPTGVGSTVTVTGAPDTEADEATTATTEPATTEPATIEALETIVPETVAPEIRPAASAEPDGFPAWFPVPPAAPVSSDVEPVESTSEPAATTTTATTTTSTTVAPTTTSTSTTTTSTSSTTTSTTTTSTTTTTTSTTTSTTTTLPPTTLPPTTVAATPPPTIRPPVVQAIGDSVMLGAAENLAERGVIVDAEVGRQMKTYVPIAQEITARGGWGDVVVVHLGTNGSFSEETMTGLFDALAGVPRVIVLTVHADRGYTTRNNELLATLPGRYPNVTLIDWNHLVDQCEGNCLYDDGIHLPPAGRRYYADLIFQAIGL